MDNYRTRKCKQCGERKTLTEDNFRRYYSSSNRSNSGKPRGFYRVCKTCESINNRYKYLLRKDESMLTDEERDEITLFEELFQTLRENGLEPPNIGGGRDSSRVKNAAQQLLAKHKHRQQEIENLEIGDVTPATPDELLEWLTKPLDQYEPEYLQDEVYEQLAEKYRPQVGVDNETLLPKYDDTYRDILNQILDRFDRYEDEYYES